MTGGHPKEEYTLAPNGHVDNDPEAPYGPPREVALADIPHRCRAVADWEGLYQDVMLRLEKTDGRHVLEYPLRSRSLVKTAYGALHRRFIDRHGPGYVCLVTQKDPPPPVRLPGSELALSVGAQPRPLAQGGIYVRDWRSCTVVV